MKTLLLIVAVGLLAQMNFDQDKATHHFTLYADGGSISVSVTNSNDEATRTHVRMHLKMITEEFGRGDFSKPVMTHGETPTGIDEMKRLKDAIRYRFDETPNGGTVRITTQNAEALAAIHAFLRYQITEHKTGDPLSVRDGTGDR